MVQTSASASSTSNPPCLSRTASSEEKSFWQNPQIGEQPQQKRRLNAHYHNERANTKGSSAGTMFDLKLNSYKMSRI